MDKANVLPKSSIIISQVQVQQWALMDPECTKKPPSRLTVKFHDLDSSLYNVELNNSNHKMKYNKLPAEATNAQDFKLDSEDGWLEENEDPEIKHDPMYRSCDMRVLASDKDAHLDAPQLLDLLSEKLVKGANPKQ
ncbi:hypothetical protein BDR06DRAFT_969735 [Suillus hirtellus]|nr:hypothetical protein BDR06DRAFT_969735 [Suillus hirtellus]